MAASSGFVERPQARVVKQVRVGAGAALGETWHRLLQDERGDPGCYERDLGAPAQPSSKAARATAARGAGS